MVDAAQELARRVRAHYDARTPGQLFGEPLHLTTVQAHQTSLLTDRENHLIGLALTMTRGCQVCPRGRTQEWLSVFAAPRDEEPDNGPTR